MRVLALLRAWYERRTTPPGVPDGMHHYSLPPAEGRPFEHGIELLNDKATPMLFVLRILQEEAGLSRGDASVAVALCHQKGGVLIPMRSLAHAVETAALVVARARREGLQLACKAVSVPGTPGFSATQRSET